MNNTAHNNKAGYDMIYLAVCALHDVLPEKDRLLTMDFAAVYAMAKFHSMQAVTWFALENWHNAGNDPAEILSSELWKKWSEAKSRTLRKNILFDTERQKLFDFLEREGIWHMPLKGILLQDYYPVYGMRQMADNDILFDDRGRETVRNYFLENGYQVGQADDDSHDVFLKPPVYNFEMHFSLYRNSTNQTRHHYYADIKNHLLPYGQEHPMEFRFSDEDFYIYCTAHSYKHFTGPGTGVRSVMDTYVFLRQKENSLNWSYIEDECRKLEMQDYESAVRQLAKKLFSADFIAAGASSDVLTKSEQALAVFFISSGAHGTEKNVLIQKIRAESSDAHNITANGKWKYFLRRLFPDTEYLEKYYPFFARYKILLPCLFVYRTIRAFAKYPKKLFDEFKLLLTMKN